MTFVRTVTENQIPVVDITALVRGEAAVDVGKSLHQASSNLGFIYVKGHGLEASIRWGEKLIAASSEISSCSGLTGSRVRSGASHGRAERDARPSFARTSRSR